MTMSRTAAINLRALICIPLIGVKALAGDLSAAARARVPCTGRIWAIQPVYGVSAGTTPVTDLDAMVKKNASDLWAAKHALIDGSADTATATADVQTTALRGVVEGDELKLDLDATGGSSPVFEGYGYLVYIEPTAG